jgi:hypothetical protein
MAQRRDDEGGMDGGRLFVMRVEKSGRWRIAQSE